MTEPLVPEISLWKRLTWKLPIVLKVRVGPGRPAYMTLEQWAKNPLPWYDEWIIAWGGKWRWRIRKA